MKSATKILVTLLGLLFFRYSTTFAQENFYSIKDSRIYSIKDSTSLFSIEDSVYLAVNDNDTFQFLADKSLSNAYIYNYVNFKNKFENYVKGGLFTYSVKEINFNKSDSDNFLNSHRFFYIQLFDTVLVLKSFLGRKYDITSNIVFQNFERNFLVSLSNNNIFFISGHMFCDRLINSIEYLGLNTKQKEFFLSLTFFKFQPRSIVYSGVYEKESKFDVFDVEFSNTKDTPYKFYVNKEDCYDFYYSKAEFEELKVLDDDFNPE